MIKKFTFLTWLTLGWLLMSWITATTLMAQTQYREGADFPSPDVANTYTLTQAGTYTFAGGVQTPGDKQDAFYVILPTGFKITKVLLQASGGASQEQPTGLISFADGYNGYSSASITTNEGVNVTQTGDLEPNTAYLGQATVDYSIGTAWSIAITVVSTCTAPTVPTVSASQAAICTGATTTLSIQSGSLNDATAWKWYSGSCGGTPVGTGSSILVSPTATTTYFVRGEGGCVTTPGACASQQITVNARPQAPTVTPLSYCQGAAATSLTATGTNLRFYTTSMGGSSLAGAPTPSTAQPGTTTYYVSQTNGTGCESSRSALTVTVNPLPGAPGVQPVTYCQFATASPLTATGTNPRFYTTSMGGSPLAGAPTPSTAQPGTTTYYVSQTNGFGCEGPRAAISVTVNALPTVSITGLASAYCQNAGTITLNGSPSGGRFTVDGTPATNVNPANLAAGTHTVVYSYTAGNGCTNTTTQNVMVNPIPVASLTNNGPLSCAQSSVTLTAGGGSSYTFASGNVVLGTPGPANTVVVNSPGTYSVTVGNANGCVSTTSTSVTADQVAPSLSITPSSATLTCVSPTVSLTAVGTGSLRWSTGETSPSILVSVAGTYSVSLTGGNDCTAVASVSVSQDNAAPVASLVTSGSLTCSVTSVTLTASPNGQRYVFSSGAVQIGTSNQAVVSASGTYSVTVLSGNGCSAVASVMVNQDNAAPVASLVSSGSLTCAVTSVTLTANTGSGLTYRFSNGATPLGTGNQALVSAAGLYSVTVVSGSGCSAVASVSVGQDQTAPVASLVSSGSLTCAVTSVTLTATTGSGLTYQFSSGAVQIGTSNQAVVSTAGPYSVTVTGTNGCSVSASIPVSQNNESPTLSISPSSVTLSCSSPSVSLTALGTGSVLWNTGSANPILTVSSAGTYSVTLTAGNGCSAVASAVVSQDNTAPSASLVSSGPLSCAVTSVTLTASPSGLSYVFSAGATPIGTSNQAVVSTVGVYSVTVVSGNGCSAVASVSVSQDNTASAVSLVSSGPLSCAVTSVTLTATPSGLNYVFSPGAAQIGTSNQAVVSTAGQYSVTAISANGCSAVAQTTVVSNTAVISVTTPTPTTATQGVGFSQTFTATGGVSPYGFSLASGSLPPGLSLSTTGVLVGTPNQAGSFTLTVGATDANGCSGVSTPYFLTISEPVYVGTLRLIAPVYNCQSGAITFRTQGGDGSTTPVEYRAIGVTDWTTNPNQVVDLPVRQDANAQPLQLQVRQNGVMVSYTFDFRLFCNSTTPNQPPVFTQPPAQTATVGQPFAYRIPDETFRGLNGTAVNFMAMNLPAGLSYAADTRVISGVPTAVGSYSVTLSVSDPLSQSASGVLVIQVNPVAQPPVSTTVNQAPVFNGPLAAQSGTVGQAFAYQLPAGVFTDPNAGDVLTYSAAGLPAGLQFVSSSQTISGTPTTAGTYSVTLTATDPSGLSASGLLTITISPSGTTPPVGAQPLAVIQPQYDCTTGAITFRTTGGDGLPIYFTSVGIVGYSTQASYVLEAAIRNDANSQPLLIKATQSGVTTSYLFDFRLYCNSTVPTTPPVFSGPLPTQLGTVGVSFSYQLPPNSFTTLNGGTLNYSVTGLPAGLSFTAGSNLISGIPTQAGSVTATLTATDALNQSAQGPLVFSIAPAPTQPPVAQPLTLVAPLYDCGTGSFTFQTLGGNGTGTPAAPIEYFAVGITGFTTVAGPYTVRPAGDAQPFTLRARQSGVEVTYSWDFKTVCSGSTRVGVAEMAQTWTLRSVGNPVMGELVVEVMGAVGQSLELQLMDLNGHVVASRLIQPISTQHREVFEVSRQGAGVLLLQAQSPTRRQTLKVLKQ